MAQQLTWLPKVLRDAGLKVNEAPGWQTRGHGDIGHIDGILLHHTAGPLHGNAPSLGTVTNGRGPPNALAGPLCNLHLARDGTFTVVSARKAWHAGSGYWHGISDGNSHMIGIEMENTGLPNDQPWSVPEVDAAVRACAVLLKYCHLGLITCAGHKEYAPKRKIDPSFDMTKFRSRVAALMAGPAIPLKET